MITTKENIMQRHPHDDTVQLPSPHADPTSPLFVPIHLREAHAEIDDDTVLALKRQLWSASISGPMTRTIGNQMIIADPKDETDFALCLHWLRLDAASHRTSRDRQRRETQERDRRQHTCRLCQRVDPTASTGTGIGRDRWCQSCLDELHRQEVEAHARRLVDGRSVADLIAAARQTSP